MKLDQKQRQEDFDSRIQEKKINNYMLIGEIAIKETNDMYIYSAWLNKQGTKEMNFLLVEYEK